MSSAAKLSFGRSGCRVKAGVSRPLFGGILVKYTLKGANLHCFSFHTIDCDTALLPISPLVFWCIQPPLPHLAPLLRACSKSGYLFFSFEKKQSWQKCFHSFFYEKKKVFCLKSKSECKWSVTKEGVEGGREGVRKNEGIVRMSERQESQPRGGGAPQFWNATPAPLPALRSHLVAKGP